MLLPVDCTRTIDRIIGCWQKASFSDYVHSTTMFVSYNFLVRFQLPAIHVAMLETQDPLTKVSLYWKIVGPWILRLWNGEMFGRAVDNNSRFKKEKKNCVNWLPSSPRETKVRNLCGGWVWNLPMSPFTISELWNPSHDVLELHKIRRSTDFEAVKLWKVSSGWNRHRRFFTS